MTALAFLTLALFLLTALGSALALLSFRSREGLALQRLAAREPAKQSAAQRSVLWREWIAQLGTVLPVSTRSLPQLRKQLVRAGFRGRSAERYFQGARLVSTLLFAAVALVVVQPAFAGANWPIAAGAGAAMGYIAPGQYLLVRARRRHRALSRGLPNALDLMVVCVEAGLGIDQTTLQVSKELKSAHPEICSEFALMNLELRTGKSRVEALHNLAERTGVDDLKKLVAVLIQTDKFGTSIGQCLREHADYIRTMARQRAEAQAAKLAVKLVFPIFFCVLPSLFVVTVGPAITHMVRDLVPMIENL